MKIFEKIVRDDLLLKCQAKLHGKQHGFLPRRSCTTQLVNYVDSLSESINDNIRTDAVYFDFAKAFDSVNHDIILKKLKYKFGIDGTLLKFIMNYLKDRKQCVTISGATSGLINVRSGVPQGSILGPLFFVLFINDMVDCISDGTEIALYADDTKIWRKIRCWNDHEILQKDIDALQSWAVENKMKFHPDKCKVISFTTRTSEKNCTLWNMLPLCTFVYCLGGTVLDFTDQERDLGVIVAQDLKWDANVDALCLNPKTTLCCLKRQLFLFLEISTC